MVRNVWYMHNSLWFYLGPDGAMLKGLQGIGGKWYYFEPRKGHQYEYALYMTDTAGVQEVGEF